MPAVLIGALGMLLVVIDERYVEVIGILAGTGYLRSGAAYNLAHPVTGLTTFAVYSFIDI